MMAGLFDNPSSKVRVEAACAFVVNLFGVNTPPNIAFVGATTDLPVGAAHLGISETSPTASSRSHSDPIPVPEVVSLFDGTALSAAFDVTLVAPASHERLSVPETPTLAKATRVKRRSTKRQSGNRTSKKTRAR